MNKPSNSVNHQPNPWARIVGWLFLAPELTNRLPKTLHKDISQSVKKYAETIQAETRINDLTPTANLRYAPNSKRAVKIIVVAISTLTFGVGAKVITDQWGKFSLPAALGVSSLASFIADAQATEVMTRLRRKQSTKQALKAIENQRKTYCPINEFGLLFYQSQMVLVQQLEGKHLEKQPLHELIPVGLLSASQYALALTAVSGFGLPGGMVLNAIASGLPLALLWTAALIQSALFEVPQYDRELIEKYRSYLSIDSVTDDEATQLMLIDEQIAQVEGELDYKMALEECQANFINEGDLSGRLKNWPMAEADFCAKWLRKKIQQLEQERDQQIEQRRFQCKADIAQLPNDYEPPTGCRSPQEIQADKNRWLEKKSRELENERDQDIQWLKEKYATKIEQCEDKIAIAQKQYDAAYELWQAENPNGECIKIAQVS